MNFTYKIYDFVMLTGNVLILSAKNPEYSASLGLDILESLKYAGFNVDYVTRYRYHGGVENVFSIDKFSYRKKIRQFLYKFFGEERTNNILSILKNSGIIKYRTRVNDILFIYPDESKTFFPFKKLLKIISGKKYDFILTIFWQDMINTTLLKQIYDKLKVPIIIYAVDMAPMTGGCYYFGECQRYKIGCGKCPGLNSNDIKDKSHENYLIKKQNYERIKCALIGNSWMLKFAKQSNLFNSSVLNHCNIVINDTFFSPADMNVAREKLGIEDKNAFIILYRSSGLLRKGGEYFIRAVERLYKTNLNKNVLILTIGDDFILTHLRNEINHIHLGFVDTEKLRYAYQAANVFMNTSLDDAGPSMVNQSILCGTPVVCFDNGVALDVIINGCSGFKYETKNFEGLCEGIIKILLMDQNEYLLLRESTRKIAKSFNSYHSFSTSIIETISLLNK